MEREKVLRLAVIPARGGFTRLENKNLLDLGGRPLISHTIEAVLDSACFDTVMVSTDHDDIAGAAEGYPGVVVHRRPQRYAGAQVTVLEAMLALMPEVPHHDVFTYLLPTCPLREASDIRSGIEMLTADTDAVVSVTAFEDPPQMALIRHGSHVIPVFDNLTSGVTNSLFCRQFYRPNGGFYMAWWDRLLEHRNFFVGERVVGHVMPKHRSVGINDALDLEYAELLLAKTRLAST